MSSTSIVDLILIVVLMNLSVGMFSWQLENKPHFLLRYFLSFATILGISVGSYFIELHIDGHITNSNYQNIIKNSTDFILIGLSIFSVFIYKKCGKKSVAFVGAAGYALVTAVVNVYSLFTVPFFGPNALISIPSGIFSTFFRIAAFILAFVLLFAISWLYFMRNYIKRNYSFAQYSVSNTGFILIFIVFIVNFFIGDDQITTGKYALGLLCKILSCMLVLFTLFGQFNYFSLKFENAQLQSVMETQKKQYEITRESIDQINVKAHDIKHVINMLNSDSDIPSEFKEQLISISEQYQNVYNTGNKALDIALSDNCKDFESLGITFSVIADGAALSFMKDVDVFAMFSNILSNSKEATLQQSESNKRFISLYVKQDGKFVSIHCENTFDKKPLKYNGRFITSKGDKLNHGYGLKSIELIANQYGGNMKITVKDNNMFILDILFIQSIKG